MFNEQRITSNGIVIHRLHRLHVKSFFAFFESFAVHKEVQYDRGLELLVAGCERFGCFFVISYE